MEAVMCHQSLLTNFHYNESLAWFEVSGFGYTINTGTHWDSWISCCYHVMEILCDWPLHKGQCQFSHPHALRAGSPTLTPPGPALLCCPVEAPSCSCKCCSWWGRGPAILFSCPKASSSACHRWQRWGGRGHLSLNHTTEQQTRDSFFKTPNEISCEFLILRWCLTEKKDMCRNQWQKDKSKTIGPGDWLLCPKPLVFRFLAGKLVA